MRHVLVLVTMLWLMSGGSAAAITLATAVDTFNVSTNFSGGGSGARISICFGTSNHCRWMFGPNDALTTGVIVGDQEDGATFTLDSGANFDYAVASLTDGVDGRIGFLAGFAPNTSTGYSQPFESDALDVLLAGGNGIDLAGYTITSITMTIPEIRYFRNGSNASTSGTILITISGVPEPTTAALLALGLAALGARGRAGRRLIAEEPRSASA